MGAAIELAWAIEGQCNGAEEGGGGGRQRFLLRIPILGFEHRGRGEEVTVVLEIQRCKLRKSLLDSDGRDINHQSATQNIFLTNMGISNKS